jgi:neopullulanase
MNKKINTLLAFAFIIFGGFLATPLSIFAQDTFNAEQRLPDGAKYPIPKRIPATATTEPFETRIDPPNWWAGFSDPTVELMIHDKNVRDHAVAINHVGIKVLKIDRPENANYLFVTLSIANTTKAGDVNIVLTKGTDKRTLKWRIDARTKGNRNLGINQKDFVYLLMPDRFANGDYSNDSFDKMTQKGIDRRKMYFRHGGDLKGVINNLDYLQDLGVTALWLNPVQENDQPYESYHGYAMTDFYNVDKRFGTNKDYKDLADKCHAKGMKIVMDLVNNHVGDQNYFIKDLPESSWIHQFDTFTQTNYRDQTIADPYASEYDRAWSQDRWFVSHMPDLNPEGNPHLEKYIIQNHLWWLEYAGVDSYRMDTYFYNDLKFMSRWAKRLRTEFPKLHIFGETWIKNIINQAHNTEGVKLPKKFDSNMQGVTDFQLYFKLIEALTKQQTWDDGVIQLYQGLGNDIIYKDPTQNVTFLDNHDLSRMYSILDENMDKYKSAIAWLMTCRGIPQWYYGAELAFSGYTNPDGKVRQDMPGGWKEDTRSVFTEGGRTDKEKDIYNYVKKLAQWRKTKSSLHDGKLMHYLPVDGVYVYFRYNAAETVMVVMNTSDKPQTFNTARFNERLKGFSKAKNVVTDAEFANLSRVEVGAYQTLVLDLKR